MTRNAVARILWSAALAISLVNLLAQARRLPALRREKASYTEQADQYAARRLKTLRPAAAVYLLLHRKNIDATWFRYRLAYLIYPVRLRTLWDRLPTSNGPAVLVEYMPANESPGAQSAASRVHICAWPRVSPQRMGAARATTRRSTPAGEAKTEGPAWMVLAAGILSICSVLLLGAM
ncbi:MAG TPA: hypothetical protein VGS41_12590, partial [Chthonomonadales bacterium]|nr:hypothetical protein [Chthonomonadales bacterium]